MNGYKLRTSKNHYLLLNFCDKIDFSTRKMFEIFLWFIFYFVCVIFIAITLLYVWFNNRYKFWDKRNIYTLKPKFPHGNAKELMTGDLHMGEQYGKYYLENKSKPYIGTFLGHKPTLVVNDLDMIKDILVKEFVHFTDHGFVHNEHYEPLEGHLFNVNGNRWRNLRIRLLPSFSTGKMKIMFDTIIRYSIEMQDYLEPYVETHTAVDLKEMLSRFGTDIIGTCVFGIECKSITSELSKIRLMSRKSQRLNFIKTLIQNLSFTAPWIISRLRMSMYQTDVNDFFVDTAKELVEYRKQNNFQGNDYMQILCKLREERIAEEQTGKEIGIIKKCIKAILINLLTTIIIFNFKDAETQDDATMSTGDVAAQLFVFFVDGVETSSTTASFALYELARNQDVQEKLVTEIREVIAKHGGRLTFDAFSDMKYLSQVIEEALRMYPPLPLLLRVCTKDYYIPGTHTKIEKGDSLAIPIMGIHRDADIYPNPMQFNPDNFSPEKKAERHRFAHLPFGEGPRMCMGTRFSALMTRMGLVSILSKYKVTIDSKYVKPFKFVPSSFILVPTDGINLNLEKRENPLQIKS